METLLKDLRHGIRLLARSPLFAGVAILTLALGIGANTTIFSVINGVLLKPLPYQDPERLTMIWTRFDAQDILRAPLSGPELVDFRERTDLFEDVGGIWARYGALGGDHEPELIDIGWVTANFFDVLGVKPLRGRNFLPEEDVPNGPAVILLSHEIWQRRYGGDPQIVGGVVRFNSEPYTVVGVMPPGFQVLAPPDAGLPASFGAWLPWGSDYAGMRRDWRRFSTVARLRPGVSRDQAQAELSSLAGRLREQHEEYVESGLAVDITKLHADLVAEIRPALLALMGASAFVMLIACANVANLLLVRSAARDREMAVRGALGAERGRLVRQILTESLVLFLLGGVAGLLVAELALDVLVALQPANLPRLDAIGIDFRTLGFNVLAIFLTGLAFGAVPAWQASRGDLTQAFKEGGRATRGSASQRLRSLLVVVEVALSLALLIGAILMLRSFLGLWSVERGFDPAGVLTLRTSLPYTRYAYTEPEKISSFYDQLVTRTAALPGVEYAGTINFFPLANVADNGDPYSYETPAGEPEWGSLAADYRSVTAAYFRTVGTRLLAGRLFTAHDEIGHPNVAIVDEKLARRAWPEQNPIGKRLKISIFVNGTTEILWAEVVGVVEHVRNYHLAVEGREQIYLPHQQSPRRSMTLAVRSSVDLAYLVDPIRREVQALDPERPIFDVRPMQAYVSDAMAQTRFTLQLIGVFALMASGLALVGIYGVVASTVRQMRQEISVRIALGARSISVLRLVLGWGMKLVALGEVVGLAVAFAMGRVMSSLVFGVSVRDFPTFAIAALLTIAAALAACYLPARLATRLDPMVALRSE